MERYKYPSGSPDPDDLSSTLIHICATKELAERWAAFHTVMAREEGYSDSLLYYILEMPVEEAYKESDK
jgi:hypothetical protein